MKQTIIHIILLYFLSSCYGQNNCCKLELILNDERVQNYFHSDIENRKNLYLVENKYCSLSFENSEGLKVTTIKKEDVDKYTNVIYLMNITNYNDFILLILVYPIEGATFEIKVFRDNKLDVRIIEI